MVRPYSLLVLDTSVFVQAHRNYYSLDICPGFWRVLSHFTQSGDLLSIDRVRKEIFEPDEPDELMEWANQAPSGLFVSTGEQSVVDAFSQMQTWVYRNTQFSLEAKEEFARVADGWVVAYAKAHDAVLVTQEVFDENVKKRVPLPNVCKQFGVPYLGTFEMLRQLGAKFGWQHL